MATRSIVAMAMLDQLADLARGWRVEIAEYDGVFTVEVCSKRNGSIFTYTGPSLPRLVAAAWAGEPSGVL